MAHAEKLLARCLRDEYRAHDGWIHSGRVPGCRLFSSGVITKPMVEQQDMNQVQAPSKQAIAKATAIALAVALVILFVAILPAEYGIDPLKTGKALHLTDLAKATELKAESKPVAGARPVAAQAGIYTTQPANFKNDSEDLSLMPGEGVEIKYHMLKGAGMIYSWK